MKNKVVPGSRLFGPFLIDRDLDFSSSCKVHKTYIESETGNIIAEHMTKKSTSSLRYWALGQRGNVSVFYTPVPPIASEVMSGLDKYIGWEGQKKLPINKVFDVNEGVVKKHDINLIKKSFPEVFEDLQSHVTLKK